MYESTKAFTECVMNSKTIIISNRSHGTETRKMTYCIDDQLPCYFIVYKPVLLCFQMVHEVPLNLVAPAYRSGQKVPAGLENHGDPNKNIMYIIKVSM